MKISLEENTITVAPIKESYKVGEFYLINTPGENGRTYFGRVKFLSEQEICFTGAFYMRLHEGIRPQHLDLRTIAISGFGNAGLTYVFSINPLAGDVLISRNLVESAHQLDLKNLREAAHDKNNPYYFYNYVNSGST